MSNFELFTTEKNIRTYLFIVFTPRGSHLPESDGLFGIVPLPPGVVDRNPLGFERGEKGRYQ